MSRAERLLNLFMYLIEARRPASAAEIRREIEGYDPEASDEAFARMFERDKDDLRTAGIPIRLEQHEGGESVYRIDRSEYYLPPLELTSREASAARLVAAALAADPGFPMADELRLALLKLSSELPDETGGPGRLMVRLLPEASAQPDAEAVARLTGAMRRRKTVSFEYRALAGVRPAPRAVDPYGLYYALGSWYLVGRDHDRDAIRTFRIGRISSAVSVASSRPRQPDFGVPEDFDIRDHEGRAWELGATELGARVRFQPHVAWLAERQVKGSGTFTYESDGTGMWEAERANEDQLVRWVLGFGAAAEIVAPAATRTLAAQALSRMAVRASDAEA